MIMDGMDNTYKGYNEEYPLHVAAQKGDYKELERLIEKGQCVNGGNFDSVTALHEACLAGQEECVNLLIASGANVNARNIDGATPLCDAANNGNTNIVSVLLKHGAQVNPPLNFTSPLHESVLRDMSKVTEILINAGANLELNDLHFGTPLHVATFKDHVLSAKQLLLAGARVNAAKIHQTALHLACINNSLQMTQLLLLFGANVHAENHWGVRASQMVSCRSPLHKVLKSHEGMVKNLQDMCRLCLRQHLTHHKLRSINALPLPKYLKQYLEYT